jgi:hypothetical protein
MVLNIAPEMNRKAKKDDGVGLTRIVTASVIKRLVQVGSALTPRLSLMRQN